MAALRDMLVGIVFAVITGAVLYLALSPPYLFHRLEQGLGSVVAAITGTTCAAVFATAFVALLLAEARRVRGPLYWIAVGASVALVTLTVSPAVGDGNGLLRGVVAVLSGSIGGAKYWRYAGRRAGHVRVSLARLRGTPGSSS